MINTSRTSTHYSLLVFLTLPRTEHDITYFLSFIIIVFCFFRNDDFIIIFMGFFYWLVQLCRVCAQTLAATVNCLNVKNASNLHFHDLFVTRLKCVGSEGVGPLLRSSLNEIARQVNVRIADCMS